MVVLAAYVGSYEFRAPEDPNFVMLLNVSMTGEVLFVDVAGKDKQELIPLSDTTFAMIGGRVSFAKNDKNVVTHMIFQAVEGDLKAVRKPK